MTFYCIPLAVIWRRFTFTPTIVITGLQVTFYFNPLAVSSKRFTLTPAVLITGIQVTFYCIPLAVICRRFTFTPTPSACYWAPGDILLYQSCCQLWQIHIETWAGIFKKSMGARHRGWIGFSYRPASLHRLAEFIPWNQFRGPINI